MARRNNAPSLKKFIPIFSKGDMVKIRLTDIPWKDRTQYQMLEHLQVRPKHERSKILLGLVLEDSKEVKARLKEKQQDRWKSKVTCKVAVGAVVVSVEPYYIQRYFARR